MQSMSIPTIETRSPIPPGPPKMGPPGSLPLGDPRSYAMGANSGWYPYSNRPPVYSAWPLGPQTPPWMVAPNSAYRMPGDDGYWPQAQRVSSGPSSKMNQDTVSFSPRKTQDDDAAEVSPKSREKKLDPEMTPEDREEQALVDGATKLIHKYYPDMRDKMPPDLVDKLDLALDDPGKLRSVVIDYLGTTEKGEKALKFIKKRKLIMKGIMKLLPSEIRPEVQAVIDEVRAKA